MFRELPSSYHLYIFPSKKRAPSRFRQSVIAPPRHLTNAAETPLQSSRGCEEVSLSPMPSSRPICQIGFKPHESLRLCHRRAARFIALAWVSYLRLRLCTYQRSKGFLLSVFFTSVHPHLQSFIPI